MTAESVPDFSSCFQCHPSDFLVSKCFLSFRSLLVLSCHCRRLLLPIVDHSSVHASNPRWLAPEALRDNVYSFKADVYSFGIILWELLTWQQPWEECGPCSCHTITIYNWVLEGHRPMIPPQDKLPAGPCPVYDDLVQLMRQCWDQEPSDRPTFSTIVQRLDEMLRVVVKTEVSVQTNSSSYALVMPSDEQPAFKGRLAVENGERGEENLSGRVERKMAGSPVKLSPRRSPPPMSPFLETTSASPEASPRPGTPDLPSPFKKAAMNGTPWPPSSQTAGGQATGSGTSAFSSQGATGKKSGKTSGSTPKLSPRRSPPPISPFLDTRSSSPQPSPRPGTPDSPSPFKKAAMNGTPWPQPEKLDVSSSSTSQDAKADSVAASAKQTAKSVGEGHSGSSQPCDSSAALLSSPSNTDAQFDALQVRAFGLSV